MSARHRRRPAPIYLDALALCEWIQARLGQDARPVARALCRTSLRLLEVIALALQGRDTEARLDEADERLISLRTQLRVAPAAGCLTESQMLYALECCDTVGRQLGGWLRTLGPA